MPVATLRTVMSAPAMAAPDWSTTPPTMVAFVVWARATKVSPDRVNRASNATLDARNIVRPPLTEFDRHASGLVSGYYSSQLAGTVSHMHRGNKSHCPLLYR